MIVLDADSLMDAEVFVELVYRMDADPELGLLQTPTLPLGDRSLLSRCQQFAAKLCTPMLGEALEWFSADGGNYWGHNAIIRTAVFTRFCGLGDLPGKAPLGGQILSHDFVEAALMQRAGYKVARHRSHGELRAMPDDAAAVRAARSALVPGQLAAHSIDRESPHSALESLPFCNRRDGVCLVAVVAGVFGSRRADSVR